MTGRWVLPFARAYCRLASGGIPDAELLRGLERRAAGVPAWARWVAALGAWAIRWWAPLFYLARPRRFESLPSEEADEVLQRLQYTRSRVVKGVFLAVKVLVLPVCYGNKRHLARIGYALKEEAG